MPKRSQNLNDVRHDHEVTYVRLSAVAGPQNEANFHGSFTFVAVSRQAGLSWETGPLLVDTESGESALWQSGRSAIGGSRQTRHDPQGLGPRRLTGRTEEG